VIEDGVSEKSRKFANWFAQELFPQWRKNVETPLAGSTTSPLHPLKTKEHVIPDRAKQRQMGNTFINSA
jgi:hypothetical protein